jgi:hypothetical protein
VGGADARGPARRGRSGVARAKSLFKKARIIIKLLLSLTLLTLLLTLLTSLLLLSSLLLLLTLTLTLCVMNRAAAAGRLDRAALLVGKRRKAFFLREWAGLPATRALAAKRALQIRCVLCVCFCVLLVCVYVLCVLGWLGGGFWLLLLVVIACLCFCVCAFVSLLLPPRRLPLSVSRKLADPPPPIY